MAMAEWASFPFTATTLHLLLQLRLVVPPQHLVLALRAVEHGGHLEAAEGAIRAVHWLVVKPNCLIRASLPREGELKTIAIAKLRHDWVAVKELNYFGGLKSAALLGRGLKSPR